MNKPKLPNCVCLEVTSQVESGVNVLVKSWVKDRMLAQVWSQVERQVWMLVIKDQVVQAVTQQVLIPELIERKT